VYTKSVKGNLIVVFTFLNQGFILDMLTFNAQKLELWAKLYLTNYVSIPVM